jgi:hypothetical protein
MNKMIDYLISIGYTCIKSPESGYSSVTKDGLISIYKKDNSQWTFGLNEKGHHPTLIHPRPYKEVRVEQDGDIFIGMTMMLDSDVNYFLSNNDPIFIYDELNHLSRI